MKICNKPKNWNSLAFNEKLIYFNEQPHKLRSMLSDKFIVKKVIKKFVENKIPDLHYANVITHLFSYFNKNTDNYLYIVPIEHEFLHHDLLIQNLVKNWENQGKTESFIENELKMRDITRIEKKDKALYEKKYAKRCIIKYSCAWNSYIFLNKNRVTSICKGIHNLPPYPNSFYNWRNMCVETFLENPKRDDIEAVIFAEEFIEFNMAVYQFYCIKGKPLVFMYYNECGKNRYLNSYEINQDVRIKNEEKFKYIDDQVYSSKTKKFDRPLKWEIVQRMQEMCLEMSKSLEFVRLDFYNASGKIYFSEYSFSPYSLKKLISNDIVWGESGEILSNAWTD